MEYDDIVVGAGSSGAVLAARLSEDPNRSVLLLEAGPDYASIERTPADLLTAWVSLIDHDWGLMAKATPGREIAYARGKVTGGSSAVNGAIALRGIPADFDEWAAMGNSEWSFANLLPYYRKLESDCDFAGDFHGMSGPIPVERPKRANWQPANLAFFESCRRAGYPESPDHNAPDSTGIGPWPRNTRSGARISTAIAYLHRARHRLNLTIRADALANRVLVERGRAVGVEVECGGEIQRIRARRVTLSAGAIASPAILIRSGIGPKRELDALGITPLVDLPGVGKNLIDHVMVMVWALPVPGVPHDSRVINPVGLRYTASGSSEFDDMQLHFFTFYDWNLARGLRAEPNPPPLIAYSPGLQRPRSRGRLVVTSDDPHVPPQIELNYLDHPDDVSRMLEGVRLGWRLMGGPELKPYVKEYLDLTQEIVDSDEKLTAFIRANCSTIFHPVGTARMGPDGDPAAVVDQYCRVRGVDGLRVADASVMPNIVSANTNLTCIAIGERVADWMREER
jgi:choline dehydrogenase